MKLHRSHKYLLQLYETELVLVRRNASTPSMERIEIPLSQIPAGLPDKFEKNKSVYIPLGKDREIKLKPRPVDCKVFLEVLHLATTYSQAPHNTDLIDLNF